MVRGVVSVGLSGEKEWDEVERWGVGKWRGGWPG